MTVLAKYGAAFTLRFNLYDPTGVTLVSGITHQATGISDTRISLNGNPYIASTNGFTEIGEGLYQIVLSAAEMSTSQLMLKIVDQTNPKAWLDTDVRILTVGNASAHLAFDLDNERVTLAAATHTGATIPTVTQVTGTIPLPSGAALESSLQGVSNKVGPWAGSGDNTLLGGIRALARADGPTPSDLGGTFDPAADSLEAIRNTEPLGTSMRGTDGAAQAADVLSQVRIALSTDDISELSAGSPSATPSVTEAIMLMYMHVRNQAQSGSGSVDIRNDSGNVVARATVTDDGVTFTKGKYIAP